MTQVAEEISVLLVDDERDFLVTLSRALSTRGFTVETADGGEAAVAILGRCPATDVVVLDVKMPGIDGVQLFGGIRFLYPGLPVIMLTGHGTVAQAFETSKDGVYEYLTKPCDVDHLAGVIRRAVRSGDAREMSQ